MGLALKIERHDLATRDTVSETRLILISDSFSLQIVTKDSCTIGVSNENVVPLPADHVNMCRIESRGDKAYRIVLRHCKEIATEVLNKHTVRD